MQLNLTKNFGAGSNTTPIRLLASPLTPLCSPLALRGDEEGLIMEESHEARDNSPPVGAIHALSLREEVRAGLDRLWA